MIRIILTIILFLGIPGFASADYVVAGNMNNVVSNFPGGYTSLSTSATTTQSGHAGMVWTATSTATQIDRIDIPLCTNTASPTGTLKLDVWSVSDAGLLHAIASSSLSASGNVWYPCGSPNATTTTFVITPSLQVVAGTRLLFDFWAQASPAYSWFTSLNSLTDNRSVYTPAGSTTPFTTTESLYGASATSFQYILRATGIPPVVYNASSSNISCSTFDIGCYITNGLALLFYPQDWTFDQLDDLQDQLASTTPFGYGYELVDTINTALSVASSSFEITADLSDFGTVFQNATSVPIVSSEALITFAGDDWALVQSILAGGFYLILLSYFWFRFFNTI